MGKKRIRLTFSDEWLHKMASAMNNFIQYEQNGKGKMLSAWMFKEVLRDPRDDSKPLYYDQIEIGETIKYNEKIQDFIANTMRRKGILQLENGEYSVNPNWLPKSTVQILADDIKLRKKEFNNAEDVIKAIIKTAETNFEEISIQDFIPIIRLAEVQDLFSNNVDKTDYISEMKAISVKNAEIESEDHITVRMKNVTLDQIFKLSQAQNKVIKTTLEEDNDKSVEPRQIHATVA